MKQKNNIADLLSQVLLAVFIAIIAPGIIFISCILLTEIASFAKEKINLIFLGSPWNLRAILGYIILFIIAWLLIHNRKKSNGWGGRINFPRSPLSFTYTKTRTYNN